MFIVVCYDIRCPKRLRKVARLLEGYGDRVQDSVFECHLDTRRLTRLKQRMARRIDPEHDRVRYYPLCHRDRAGIQIDGFGQRPKDPDLTIV